MISAGLPGGMKSETTFVFSVLKEEGLSKVKNPDDRLNNNKIDKIIAIFIPSLFNPIIEINKNSGL